MHAVMGSGRLIAGRYRLQGPIGRGAMGIVWRGRDELLARDVAVKEVQITSHASPTDAETLYQRTLREARTAARLSHPSVVTVFDVVEENGSPWIVMELVDARSLDQVITEDGPLPPLQAAELGTSLVSALATAHSAGVLHRDVKPSNVLVTADGKAVLTDFGIATFAEDPSVTQVGMVVGTPGFTAPERVRGETASFASDLWSLGATLYAAVEGRGPFDRVGGSAVITAGVASEDAPRAPSAGPLGPVINALLSRDPGTRPDATTAARLLAEAATAARTGARPLAVDPAAPESAQPGPGEEGSDFLDPPVFASLSMPDPTGPGEVATEMHAPDAGAPALVVAGAAVGAADEVGAGPELFGAGTAAGATAGAGATAAGASAGAVGIAASPIGAAAGGLGQADQAGSGGPVLWQPVKSGTGGSAATPPPAGPGGAAGGGSGGGGSRFRRGGPAKPSSGRWRLMVAGAGIAAIVVAAVVGWSIYTHSETTQALQTQTVPGVSTSGGGNAGPAASGPGHSGSAGKAGHSGTSPAGSGPGTAASGHSPGVTKPGGKPTGTPSAGTSPSPSSSPTASPSGSPSPSPSPSSSVGPGGTGPVLPPGYVWHHFSAGLMGSSAGFKIAMPSLWRQNVTGLVAHLNQPASNFHLTVSLGLWTYVKPLPQAQYLQGKAAKTYNAYKERSLSAVGFKTVGGYRPAAAATLKFSWHKKGAGDFTELIILVTLSTKSGVQPYTFAVWAPEATFPVANAIMHTAMTTFRPLPAG